LAFLTLAGCALIEPPAPHKNPPAAPTVPAVASPSVVHTPERKPSASTGSSPTQSTAASNAARSITPTAPPTNAALATESPHPSEPPSPADLFLPLPDDLHINGALRMLLTDANANGLAKNYDAAEASLSRAVRIGGNNPWVWIGKAQLRLAQSEPKAASAFARKAKALALHDARAQARAATLLEEAVKLTP